ncbi:Os11g0109616 [Oryza sativa Japonica Group]|uniref:Os11g0109616 protein n=1 Tax=Oryza sativa subsp. japonica TaxID=39947 RepID=A0A0P0XYZ1_ORYSJ|nr:hypothetical protein EE612_053131 [Oryza sativa]BAT12352.1 Os11g0109616 [Oryza sativa Japonica Group]
MRAVQGTVLGCGISSNTLWARCRRPHFAYRLRREVRTWGLVWEGSLRERAWSCSPARRGCGRREADLRAMGMVRWEGLGRRQWTRSAWR